MRNDIRAELEALLARYAPEDGVEAASVAAIRRFASEAAVLGRANLAGHLTASALVVNRGRTRILLNHHAKLGKWLQFGGHVEEGEGILAAALRETREESGLRGLELASEALFDADVHLIPERPGAAAHYHYDLRFLVAADEAEAIAVSPESRELRWVALSELEDYTREESMLRMARKLAAPARR